MSLSKVLHRRLQDWRSARCARGIVLERGHRLIGARSHARQVRIRRRGSALLATMVVDDRSERLVLKRLPPTSHFPTAAGLCGLHRRVRSCSDILQRGLPWLREVPHEPRWLAIEYLPGITLERSFHHALGAGQDDRQVCEQAGPVAQFSDLTDMIE